MNPALHGHGPPCLQPLSFEAFTPSLPPAHLPMKHLHLLAAAAVLLLATSALADTAARIASDYHKQAAKALERVSRAASQPSLFAPPVVVAQEDLPW